MNPYIFEEKGIIWSPLLRKEAIGISRNWVRVFFLETREKTGKFQPTKYKWESYWSGDEPCLSGNDALAEYCKSRMEPFYIIDESGKNGVACPPQQWPLFVGLGMDLYIIPESFAWSMAFTHEGTCHYASTLI